jgi:hypothetical protein
LVVATATAASTAPATYDGIQLVGDAGFVSWTNQALALLQTNAPTWYTQVKTYLSVILQMPTGTGRITVGTRTVQAGDETTHDSNLSPARSPGLSQSQSLAYQLAWYASVIVHESCHEREYEHGQPFSGKPGELPCLSDQEAALLLTEPGPTLSNYVQGIIDGADDPTNQYWLHPMW